MRRLVFVWLIIAVLALVMQRSQSTVQSQIAVATSAPSVLNPDENFIRSQRLGITFISSPDIFPDERRYRQGLVLGAGWNRWPMYWDRIERSPEMYTWDVYDQLVDQDLAHGLQINAILLGMPGFHRSGDSIQGLHEPIYSDGTDNASPGKGLNPNNPWANYVYQAVVRYKPDGILARERGWAPGQGVTVWEAWNEPDFDLFWQGGLEDYARLLKVTYIVAHQADPNAKVMFGGLAYTDPENNDWLTGVLDIFSQDPEAVSHDFFIDQVAIHSYTYARRTGLVVRRVRHTLADYGLADRPVWLNETGVPVWNDYPGPTWTANVPEQRVLRATLQQQAAYLMQSSVYAWHEGADVVFIHQLFDDCGNQPFGTDFLPHQGELCVVDALCYGDAHGLYRNNDDSACFSEHPLPGTPRPAATAFLLLAEHLGNGTFINSIAQSFDDGGIAISFDRVESNERIHLIWNDTFETIHIAVPASADRAALITGSNQDRLLSATNNTYLLQLEPARPDDYPYLLPDEVTGIGSAPFILVEALPLPITIVQSQPISTPERDAVAVPFVSQRSGVPRPTVDPALDMIAPVTSMIPLPVVSPLNFLVSWQADDPSGIDRYIVWVRINDGDWQPWLGTELTEAHYAGQSGFRYEFSIQARDLAGNWSRIDDLAPQAVTRVQ